MKQEIKKALETYNKIAKIYVKYTADKLLQFQLNKFISLVPKKAKVLDIGCGGGRDVAYFLEENLDAFGIDTSNEILKEAKALAKKDVFKKMDMLSLKFKENTFDGLWVVASLFHLTKKDSPTALKEFFRVLKPGGIIYISVKEGQGEKVIMQEKYNNLPRFFAFYSQQELENLLKENSFKILSSTVNDDQGAKWVEVFAKKPPVSGNK